MDSQTNVRCVLHGSMLSENEVDGVVVVKNVLSYDGFRTTMYPYWSHVRGTDNSFPCSEVLYKTAYYIREVPMFALWANSNEDFAQLTLSVPDALAAHKTGLAPALSAFLLLSHCSNPSFTSPPNLLHAINVVHTPKTSSRSSLLPQPKRLQCLLLVMTGPRCSWNLSISSTTSWYKLQSNESTFRLRPSSPWR